jgi:putative transposase
MYCSPQLSVGTHQARQISWQLQEDDTSAGFLIRDNNKKLSASLETVFKAEAIKIIRIPLRAPNANAIAERWVRSIREECLDHLIILNITHLHSVLKEYHC